VWHIPLFSLRELYWVVKAEVCSDVPEKDAMVKRHTGAPPKMPQLGVESPDVVKSLVSIWVVDVVLPPIFHVLANQASNLACHGLLLNVPVLIQP
jgi:hypothetical protein